MKIITPQRETEATAFLASNPLGGPQPPGLGRRAAAIAG
jgi:hypothetical protein